MADIHLKRQHDLGAEGARKAADQMAERLGKEFGLSGKWKGNVLHFDRSGVHGTLAVTDHDMQLEVHFGFLLRMMKGPIEKAIHEQLDQVLTKAPKSTESVAKKATKSPKAATQEPKTAARARKKSSA